MEDSSSASAGPSSSRSDATSSLTRPSARLGVVPNTRRLGNIACASEAMRETLTLLERVAKTDVTVTLVGETGAGKDVLASAIHAESARSSGPFVVFDCGSVAANLAESELLGHERGSFTGAVTTHAGAFERAHGGTLFLDEIGELPLDLQPRLLRSLENRAVRRVGGTQYRPVDVRVIAATNRDLAAAVAAGTFRQDLYFRLAGAVVPVPALRERVADIPLLVERLMQDLGRPDVTLSEDALRVLAEHSWPGNVRELKNTLSCALALLEGNVLAAGDLRFVTLGCSGSLERLPLGGVRLTQIERIAIKQTLEQVGGNKSDAARALGIAVSTLYEKLKRHGL
ncbi:MAG TPA: sigma-54 dependent transcriptional regulator [Polyangiaceae bacterium]|nr:sigma-54 dependent transcriptional regulator [Polyangiaceae bacterium]